MLLTSKVKQELIQVLKQDGFKIIDKKTFVIATKNENILYIHNLEKIQTELNLIYLMENLSLKNAGGVPISELKKLLQEGENKKIDLFSYISNKLNWSVQFSDNIIFGKHQIKYYEVITDSNNVLTFVFPDQNKKDFFFVLDLSYRKFLKLLDSVQYKSLSSYAPNFFNYLKELD